MRLVDFEGNHKRYDNIAVVRSQKLCVIITTFTTVHSIQQKKIPDFQNLLLPQM